MPVYEIYKVGEAPRWLDGLDLLTRLGLPVAVIPHYDNAEGGTHDTRFCYLGERRLAVLEAMLPDGHFVLGVDSHTALVLDLAAGTASVVGLGSVTVRAERPERGVHGRHDAAHRRAWRRLPADCGRCAWRPGTAAGAAPEPDRQPTAPTRCSRRGARSTSEVRELEARFDEQLRDGRVAEAVRTTLAMDHLLLVVVRDTDGTDDLDRARQAFQSLIVRLGERATQTDEPAATDRLAPLVELLIDLRGRARASRDFRQADWIRDALVEAGIELRDGPDGTDLGGATGRVTARTRSRDSTFGRPPTACCASPELRWILVARVANAMGSSALLTVLGYQVYQLTHDPFALGLLGLVAGLPALALGLFGGHVADRRDRRTIIVVTAPRSPSRSCCWRSSRSRHTTPRSWRSWASCS